MVKIFYKIKLWRAKKKYKEDDDLSKKGEARRRIDFRGLSKTSERFSDIAEPTQSFNGFDELTTRRLLPPATSLSDRKADNSIGKSNRLSKLLKRK